MSDVIISPSKLYGTVDAPPSKSMAHRYILCAALSRSFCVINNITKSQDIEATAECVKALGAKIEYKGNSIHIDARNFGMTKNVVLDCFESGSTLRFLIPICSALDIDAQFTGRGRLKTRPLSVYLDVLPNHNVKCEYENCLPLRVSGALNGGVFRIPGDVSSQFVTGLLLSLPLLYQDSDIIFTSPLQSSSYVDMTLNAMKKFGVYADKTADGYHIKGKQSYKGCDLTVEGDWSQGAFFLCAGAICSDVTVRSLDKNSAQGDKKIFDILRQFGADIQQGGDCVHARKSKLHGITVDASDIPDLVPIIAVTAAFAQGETKIINASRLAHKESDRLLSTCEIIRSIGGNVQKTDDSLVIFGSKNLTPGIVKGYNDHRIVMAASIAALAINGDTVISDAHSIRKSYPDFFDAYNALGGKANVFMG